MGRELAGGVGEVDDPRRRGAVLAPEDAVAETEVERRAGDDDEVGPRERGGAGLGDELGVATRQEPATHAVGDDGDAGLGGEARRGVLGAVDPDVGPEDERGVVGVLQESSDAVQVVGVGLQGSPVRTRGGAQGSGVEELVHRDVDEGRPAVRGPGAVERLVDGGGDVGEGVRGGRPRRDGLEDRRVVELLQGAHAPAAGRGAAADDHERRPGEVGLRDRADAVGDARAGREHGEARGAGQLADGLGGEHGGRLVPYVDDGHRVVGGDRGVVHRGAHIICTVCSGGGALAVGVRGGRGLVGL